MFYMTSQKTKREMFKQKLATATAMLRKLIQSIIQEDSVPLLTGV